MGGGLKRGGGGGIPSCHQREKKKLVTQKENVGMQIEPQIVSGRVEKMLATHFIPALDLS